MAESSPAFALEPLQPQQAIDVDTEDFVEAEIEG